MIVLRRIATGILYLIDHLPELVVIAYLALLGAAFVRFLLWLVNLV